MHAAAGAVQSVAWTYRGRVCRALRGGEKKRKQTREHGSIRARAERADLMRVPMYYSYDSLFWSREFARWIGLLLRRFIEMGCMLWRDYCQKKNRSKTRMFFAQID